MPPHNISSKLQHKREEVLTKSSLVVQGKANKTKEDTNPQEQLRSIKKNYYSERSVHPKRSANVVLDVTELEKLGREQAILEKLIRGMKRNVNQEEQMMGPDVLTIQAVTVDVRLELLVFTVMNVIMVTMMQIL